MRQCSILGLLACLLFDSSIALAWSGRGHHTICAAASHLVQEKELQTYLKRHSHKMGHLCNIPDTYWKSLGPEVRAVGDSTHYVDLEVLAIDPKKISLNYKTIVTEFTGQKNAFKKDDSKIISIPKEFGSNWWRAEQFIRKSAQLKTLFAESPAPQNSKEEQNEALPFNKAAYDLVNYMGLMGHFVGDNAQPFHLTADYDGWAAGHGGIHSYYEEDVVNEFDGQLEGEVLAKARALKNPIFLKENSPVAKMKALGLISFSEMKKVFQLDPIIKKSSVKVDQGMQLRTPAERKPAAQAAKKMKPLITDQMARAAVLLAHFWDQAYREAGSPALSKYKSYKYPFTVDFVEPDYL